LDRGGDSKGHGGSEEGHFGVTDNSDRDKNVTIKILRAEDGSDSPTRIGGRADKTVAEKVESCDCDKISSGPLDARLVDLRHNRAELERKRGLVGRGKDVSGLEAIGRGLELNGKLVGNV